MQLIHVDKHTPNVVTINTLLICLSYKKISKYNYVKNDILPYISLVYIAQRFGLATPHWVHNFYQIVMYGEDTFFLNHNFDSIVYKHETRTVPPVISQNPSMYITIGNFNF